MCISLTFQLPLKFTIPSHGWFMTLFYPHYYHLIYTYSHTCPFVKHSQISPMIPRLPYVRMKLPPIQDCPFLVFSPCFFFPMVFLYLNLHMYVYIYIACKTSPRFEGESSITGQLTIHTSPQGAKFVSIDMGLSENSVPLNPMVDDHYPY